MSSSTTATLTSDMPAGQKAHVRPIAIWLLCVAGLVALMVVVGGLTRLTDSGLSITEWKPVTGAVPPLSDEAWQAEFEKYQQIPEYHLQNSGMTVEDFKNIYWWEWGHRLLGRLIGVAFFVPFVWFLATGRARGRLAWVLGGLFVLGGMQGVLGWYMVMSGLVDRIDVSQYRLAAHLGLAFAIFAALLFVALDLLRFGDTRARTGLDGNTKAWAVGLFALTFLQIVLGAFVAGLDAGFIYNTWPLMNGAFFPSGLFATADAIFEDRLTVQFDHRMVAYALAVGAGVFLWRVLRSGPPRELKRAAHAFTGLIGVQIVLGIVTLLAVVPIWLGGLHQFGAVCVLAGATYLMHVALRGESA